MCVRSDCVRHKCPVRASYSRHVLPPVVGFPHLRVRCVIRHPSGLRWACPLTVLLHLPAWQESLGLPTVFDVSLPACHGLRTPADLPILANADRVVLPSGAFKPSASAIAMSKLSQHCRVRGHPYGLQDTLSTRRPSCSPWSQPQLRHGRKTRYGWVASPYPTSGRNTTRAAVGGEFPTCTLSVVQRVPSSTIAHVSVSPPLIPDGRISRVRLAAAAYP